MNSDSATPENDPNLSGLGRALLDTGGSKPSVGPWVPPTAEELHAILPQYEIVKMLGRGGMGAVYMGRQTALDRPVAIKILSAQLEESDMGFTERFKNEARAMGKLNHPAVVAVYEFGQHESGLLYIVMEYVDGTDVAKMIAKSGRLHTEHAMAITAHVCDALAYAHERGIIHRDIKPANIMVGYDGAVKVADFGLAKVSVGGQTLGLTQSGMAMGTMHYMAPEALMLGTSVDHRADIYAVGVMLYQMLTGKLPQGMFKLPSLLVPGLDPRYDAIVRKALMEDRESRYQSIREMRSELDSILTQPVVKADPAASQAQQPVLPTQARPQRPGGKPVMRPAAAPSVPQPPPRGSLAWLWMTALILAGLGGAAWMILPKEKPELVQHRDASATSEAPSPPQAVIATTSVPKTADGGTAPQVPLKSLPSTTSVSTSTPSEPGWTSLFNGKDLSGWELHPANFPADVQDGAIRIRGSSTIPGSGNMYYRGAGGTLPQWTDFEVICTVKTENKGNSGIFLHASLGVPDKNRADGIEVQVWNDISKGTTGLTGSLQRVASTSTARVRDGEWFQIKTRVEGRRVQTWLKKPDETEWQPAVDWTQPAQWQPPGNRPGIKLGSGTISLQNNPPLDGVVWFKEVKFRSLDPVTASQPESPPILGRWVRTNMDRPGDAYWMDLSADGSALWSGDNTTVRGTWLMKAGVLEVDWNSRFKFLITPPTSASSAILKGTANWPDGKSTEIVYERQATSSGGSVSLVETFNGHRYQFVPGALTWKEAKAKAESMGGHLATLTSKEENEWLLLTYRKLLTTPNRNIWLGAMEEMAGLGWKWVTGEPFTPLGWFPGEPNGMRGGGGQVGHPFMLNLYSFKDGAVGWNDSSTHFSQSQANIGFIVEWDAENPAPPASSVTPTASATTWVDTKGRSLQAKFVRLEGGNVMLDIKGRVTPVALASLSVASQQIARDLQAALAQPASKIPSDALTFGTSRYAYYSGTFTWKDARAKAEAMGGHLATVTTAAEDAWVIANFEPKVSPGRKQFWIGASQERPSLPWQWVTGEPFSYTQWAPGEPNNAKGTDAKSTPPYMLGYLIQGGRMGWNDFSESQNNWRDVIVGYLVEWDNAVSASSTPVPPTAQTATATDPAPAEAGFISLLDANQPGDWVQVGPGKLDIQNGLATTSSPSKWGVAIYSKRTFADFILKAEFKGVDPLFNSGLWLRIPDLRNDISKAEASRYEVGIVHSSGDRGRFTGSIWGIHPVRSDGLKANDWNELEVTVTGQLYVVKLNGKLVMSFNGTKSLSGYIGLEENFEGPVQFRNVRVKPLP